MTRLSYRARQPATLAVALILHRHRCPHLLSHMPDLACGRLAMMQPGRKSDLGNSDLGNKDLAIESIGVAENMLCTVSKSLMVPSLAPWSMSRFESVR